VSFIRTGLREIGLKVRRQKTRVALRHEKRHLQKSEIHLGREGCSQAANFPEVRDEIVALRKLEQEQKEVASRIEQLEEGIRQIEGQRQENAKEQETALTGLEEEKKPILTRRNEAKAVAERCDRDLAGEERRLRENEAAEHELQKQIDHLQAQTPPPEDLETRTSELSNRRAKLPAERDEIVRAKQERAEACRQAKEALATAQAEVDTAEKRITKVREEFEARDRTLEEKNRTQQEAIHEARAHHETVEKRKNPAYLNIGRHLANRGIAPPNAPHLLEQVNRHREAMDRQLAHTEELARLSSQIDQQELRKFYFCIVSVLVLLAIILPLVFHSPSKREWLPQETDTIFSLNVDQFLNADLPRTWRREQAAAWKQIWPALLGEAVQVPAVKIDDFLRVTRASSVGDSGSVREFTLVEARIDLARTLHAIDDQSGFVRSTFNGLPVWQHQNFCLGQVGPRTVAVGGTNEVQELLQVRLGLRQDLKISGPLLDRFQALDEESALRLISRDPSTLSRMFQPILAPELLESTELLGLSLGLQKTPRARLLVRLQDAAQATELERRLRDEPQRLLRLPDSQLLLYSQPPETSRQKENVEVRFHLAENAALLLLERLAKGNAPAAKP
jgi:hypothetical protein